jgi:hypothetical protein
MPGYLTIMHSLRTLCFIYSVLWEEYCMLWICRALARTVLELLSQKMANNNNLGRVTDFLSEIQNLEVPNTSANHYTTTFGTSHGHHNVLCSWPLPISRSQWPHVLKYEQFSLARTLRSWVGIPLEAWMFVCLFCVLGSGLQTGWSLVQRVLPKVLD